jgi:hypothetical protein
MITRRFPAKRESRASALRGLFRIFTLTTEENIAMSHRFRRYSKRELLGSLHVDCILSVSDLGLAPGTNRWEVLRAFLDRGEAHAERLVEDRDGFVILQNIPGRQNTGAVYVYRESLQAFFWLRFGDREDDLNSEDFQNALRVHRLVRLVADAPSKAHRLGCRRRRGRRRPASQVVSPTLSQPIEFQLQETSQFLSSFDRVGKQA